MTTPVFGDGHVTTETSADDTCSYAVSGSGAEKVELDIRTHAYLKNVVMHVGTGGANGTTDQSYGGSTPSEVYTSSRSAQQALTAVDPGKNGFADYPAIGAGLVTDNMGDFMLAGTKSYWYEGDFSNTRVDTSHSDASVQIAQALAAL